jgi:voltage-gated potassium channel
VNEHDSGSLRRRLARFINHPVTEFAILGLILVSVGLVLVEFSLPHGSPAYYQVEIANDLITWIFVIELLARYVVEQRKSRFFRKYWIDILAVVPFFRSFRILRAFRLLRLFRFGIIASRRLARFSGPFGSIKTEYIIITMSIIVVVLMGAFTMRAAEGRINPDFADIERALWFSVLTVIGGEPIGGDPNTPFGKFVTVVLMLSGLTVFAIFTGTISAVMVNSLKNIRFRTMELDEIENHVVICGWNRAGEMLVDEMLHQARDGLGRFRHIVVVTEHDGLQDQHFFRLHADHLYLLTGDYTRVDVLREAGIERASTAMLMADSTSDHRSSQDRDARTVLAAMLIEKLNKDIYTVVQLLNRDNETSLRQVGVEEIIVSDEYVGNIMATVAQSRGIVSMLDELLTSKRGHQFYRCKVPSALVGTKVADAVSILKRDHDATLLGVDSMAGSSISENVQVNPPADLVLEAEFVLIVAAEGPIS